MSSTAFTIYNASAGSGKTYTLVKEYLKILFKDTSDQSYRKILAITFTNKAVNEMKQRIVSSLHAFSQKEVVLKQQSFLEDISKDLNISTQEIQEKSRRIIQQLLHNYSGFDISTIDKFTHKIIRSFATDLNLSLTFDVLIDTQELLQEAVDSVLSLVGIDEEITQLLLTFSLDNLEEDKNWDISKNLLEMARILFKENDKKELEAYENLSLSDFITLKKTLQEQIKVLTQQSKEKALEIFKFLEHHQIDLTSFSYGTFPNKVNEIVNDKFSFDDFNKFRSPEDIRVKANYKSIVESIKPELISMMAEIYKLLGTKAFYSNIVKNIVSLSLLNRIKQETLRIESEKNQLSLSEFNSIIHEHVKNEPAPFIYERLGERYRHFFIDEFQDTSQMQWQNLVPLIDNALSSQDAQGTAGSLFLVGDPKQSIYRWRGGKAEQFIDLSKDENPFSNPSKKVQRLDTNYRSYKEVIEFNNDFFKFLSLKFSNLDYEFLYAEQCAQKINSKTGGYVEIQLLPNDKSVDKNQEYLEATLSVIEKVLAQGFSYQDIVLLTRKKDSGVLLANFLTQNEVPILSSETLLLQNSTQVKVLIAFLQFLKEPQDNQAKASFLYYIAKHKQNQFEIHDFIIQGLKLQTLSELEKWLETFDLKISFAYLQRKDLYTVVETLVQTFFDEERNLSYVQYFMDEVLGQTVKYQSSISDFLNYWQIHSPKLSIPAPEHTNAVRIMTIHKSKGLEFPVVIFPFAEESFSKSRGQVWLNTNDASTNEISKALVNFVKEVQYYSAEAQEVYVGKKQEDLFDEINVLYVTLTRAEEQLYIISRNNVLAKGNLPEALSSFFIEYLQEKNLYNQEGIYSFGTPIKKSVKEELSLEAQELLVPKSIESVAENFSFSDIKIAQRQALMWDKKSSRAIEYGNLLHQTLANITSEHSVDKAIEKMLHLGLLTYQNLTKVKDAVQRVIKHPELKMFFSSDVKVFSERMLLEKKSTNQIPDRIVFDDNKALLLDYKTGIFQTKHQNQLENYAQRLERMGYVVAKKTLVYIGSNDLKIINL